jgi:hypothetical protein
MSHDNIMTNTSQEEERIIRRLGLGPTGMARSPGVLGQGLNLQRTEWVSR